MCNLGTRAHRRREPVDLRCASRLVNQAGTAERLSDPLGERSYRGTNINKEISVSEEASAEID